MSASKANKQRVRAAEIRAEIDRLSNLPGPARGNRIVLVRIQNLEAELRRLRFAGATA
jgi:hypothetical protein